MRELILKMTKFDGKERWDCVRIKKAIKEI
jgi:hypothetical protein